MCVYIYIIIVAQNVPSISNLYHHVYHYVHSPSVLKLFCVTKTAPPTEITWQKDGVILTIGEDVLQKTRTVTDRNSSYYISTLSIEGRLASHKATYTVTVGNSHGYDTESITLGGMTECITKVLFKLSHSLPLSGITITPSVGGIINGSYVGDLSDGVIFDCSSDLFPLNIVWYRDGVPLPQAEYSNGHAIIEIISTEHHEDEYACIAYSPLEKEELNFTINVEGTRMFSN